MYNSYHFLVKARVAAGLGSRAGVGGAALVAVVVAGREHRGQRVLVHGRRHAHAPWPRVRFLARLTRNIVIRYFLSCVGLILLYFLVVCDVK